MILWGKIIQFVTRFWQRSTVTRHSKNGFLRRHNFTFANFAQENGPKISKHAYNVGKIDNNLENYKNHEFSSLHIQI